MLVIFCPLAPLQIETALVRAARCGVPALLCSCTTQSFQSKPMNTLIGECLQASQSAVWHYGLPLAHLLHLEIDDKLMKSGIWCKLMQKAYQHCHHAPNSAQHFGMGCSHLEAAHLDVRINTWKLGGCPFLISGNDQEETYHSLNVKMLQLCRYSEAGGWFHLLASLSEKNADPFIILCWCFFSFNRCFLVLGLVIEESSWRNLDWEILVSVIATGNYKKKLY